MFTRLLTLSLGAALLAGCSGKSVDSAAPAGTDSGTSGVGDSGTTGGTTGGTPADSAPPADSARPDTADSAAPRDTAPAVDPSTLLIINEFMANNVSGASSAEDSYPDWIELYNLTDEALDLSGYWLTDDLADPLKHALAEGTVLPAGGFLLLWADDAADQGPEHLAFRLDEAGEELGIYTPEGRAINLLSFGQQYPDLAAARVPDGGETWEYTYQATPGSTNVPPVPEPFTALPGGSDWGYQVGESAPEGDWTALDYDDAAWDSGPAPLGFGDTHQVTTIPYGPDSSNKFITSYFRRQVSISGLDEVSSAGIELMCDDGAVIYLNGVEVLRYNLPGGAISYATLASAAIADANEYTFLSFELDPSALVEGSNQLAVEVHQATASSSDLTFDLALIGERLSAR